MSKGKTLEVDFKALAEEERKRKFQEVKQAGEHKHEVEKVNNIMGSNAGAGSGDFHMYRNSRRVELDRLARIEREAKEAEREQAFAKQREELQKRDAERTAKRAAQRRKKKERKKGKAASEGRAAQSPTGEGSSAAGHGDSAPLNLDPGVKGSDGEPGDGASGDDDDDAAPDAKRQALSE
mmetsp:Transcript_20597/g.55544  ORF Transcript_20597/g.55544 Transcript_20597/m.55544 type:complete len:180 (+) Transcript_20597:100-639(+)